MRLDYKGLKLESNGNPDNPIVRVFKNSCFLRPLFVTTSLDLAMRWIDAHCAQADRIARIADYPKAR